MKAIYNLKQLCVVVADDGEWVTLEPVEGDENQRFAIAVADPSLLLDPTDDDIEGLNL